MNIAELSIKKSVITWVMIILFVVVGAASFFSLSWLEDPEFTIKEAVIMTPYPGASAAEVEEEVTNVIEKAIQEMGQLDYVWSRSSRGLSIIHPIIKDRYGKDSLPQVWDELRRKVGDVQGKLPPGAGPSLVNDDFGDVYGAYFAITGEGYTYKEIYDYAKVLQKELLPVQDVKRITIYANRPEVIYVEMRRDKMTQLGISPSDIYSALSAKNLPAKSGHLTLGKEYIAVNPTGEFKSEQEFEKLLISSRGRDSDQLVYLGDVADIKRGYQEPPRALMRYDGKPAIGLGISTVGGGNVVTMGKALAKRVQELESVRPVGMEGHIVSLQSKSVVEAINGFLVNLAEAVVIVVVVLLIFMGLRSAMVIGAVLFITIMGTFVFMNMGDITLQRISLGALIIGLGMLVDNAIVVTDGMRIKIEQGKDSLSAAREVVGQTAIPLLGATIVAVTAFASIGTSPDNTGEYCGTLFWVILFSLMLSWVTAVTCTPLLCNTFLKAKSKGKGGTAEAKDPYGGKFYQFYRSFLSSCIHYRWITMAVVVACFVGALIGFGSVKQSFFPDSTRPQFYADFWFPEGTSIDETTRQMALVEDKLKTIEGVQHLITQIGGGSVRFVLTYTPESPYYSFARVLIDVEDYRRIPGMRNEIRQELQALLPQAIIQTKLFVNGPSTGGKIQLRIYGPEQKVLRELAAKAEAIMLEDPATEYVRNEARNMVKVMRPQMADVQARQAGIDRPDLCRAIEWAVEGTRTGVYREEDELLPIIARLPESERIDLDNLGAIPVWSPAAQKMISADQVVTGFDTEFEDPYIWRRNRSKVITIHSDPSKGLPSELFARIKPKIEMALNVDAGAVLGEDSGSGEDAFKDFDAKTLAVRYQDMWPLKGMPGYAMAWGGDAESSAKSGASLAATLPIFFGLMVLIIIFLFNSIKKTLVICFTVPLAIIGVTVGLLALNQPFGFMALLGLLSLSGMLIKNAVVLIDEIDTQLASGKSAFEAIVDSGVSRLIPVSMAACTTILGMLPLLTDAFFVAMAVTIMFGLGFATLLTLIVVPVLYAIFFRVKEG
ncbi:MAG: efflux RND transporter permease subunit [Deltaproteobacteria bacterium]|nr:efflux RND transporter permease subunit [Deltaproteobacteria bacterium]